MQFKKVNYESLKLGTDAQVSQTYVRAVEKGSREEQFIKKTSVEEGTDAMPEAPVSQQKDFLAVALENCQKFNEEFEGTFDKS